MFKKAIHFIKYNNATILILAIIIFAGGGVFAQTEAGQEFIGEKQVKNEGVDGKLLLEADLDNFDMDHKIERITEDDKYYYVTYTCLDLVPINGAWQYQIEEKVRKVSKRLKEDLGSYLADELKEQRAARIKDLKAEKERILNASTEVVRVEVVFYSGLIGETLDLAGKIFPSYEPVKKRVMPSPTVPPTVLAARAAGESASDDLTEVYNDYIARMDPDGDDVFGVVDNCPEIPNPDQADTDGDGRGDACAINDDAPKTDDPTPDDTGTSTEGIIDETVSEEPPVEELIEEIIINNSDENTDEPAADEPAAPLNTEPEVEVIEL